MTVPNTYEAIHRLLATKGIAVLHKGQAPVNTVNLFDTVVAQGGRVTIEVDDTFLEEMRNLGATPTANHSGLLAISALGDIV